MPDPTDAHLLAAIKAAGLERAWAPHEVRSWLAMNDLSIPVQAARSIHAHAVTLARVEALEAECANP